MLLSVCVRVLMWLLWPFFASRVSRLAFALCLILTLSSVCAAAIGGGQANVGKVLIPMDLSQTDHLKAYGIAFWALQEGHPVEWLLNYRGGAFLMDFHETIVREARIRAVSFQAISAAQATRIYADIEAANMNRTRLEKRRALRSIPRRTNSHGTTPSLGFDLCGNSLYHLVGRGSAIG